MKLPEKNELHIWYANIARNMLNDKAFLVLNAEEAARAYRLRPSIVQNRFITARAILKILLSSYLKKAPQDILLSSTANGKPFVENSELHFNVSHSHHLAVYAFGIYSPVGIDIERIRPEYREEVARRYFSQNEYTYFSALPPSEKIVNFYRLWVGKEAIIKVLGEKLSLARTFTIPFCAATIPSTVRLNYPKLKLCYLETPGIFPEYQLAIAVNEFIKKISFWEWTTQEIKELYPNIIQTFP